MAGLILSLYIGACIIGLLAPQNVVVNPDLTVTIQDTAQVQDQPADNQ